MSEEELANEIVKEVIKLRDLLDRIEEATGVPIEVSFKEEGEGLDLSISSLIPLSMKEEFLTGSDKTQVPAYLSQVLQGFCQGL